MTTERWRDVIGYEGKYQVSNLGRVKSVSRIISNERGKTRVIGRILKTTKIRKGYILVNLNGDNKARTSISLHRIVANAFLPNVGNLRDVNHKNQNRTDNRVENLEWLSHKDNVRHSRAKV